MTEEEARNALFKIHFEYMTLPKEKRDEKYNDYQEKRRKIRKALAQAMSERKENEAKTK